MRYLLLIIVFLLSCSPDNEKPTALPDDKGIKVEEPDEKVILDEKEARSKRSRLKQGFTLTSDVNRRYTGSGGYDYRGGSPCEDYSECLSICDSTLSRGRSRCYRMDRELVYDMKQALFTLRNIDQASSVGIDPYTFGALLDTDKRAVRELIEEKMSEGDVKSFLAWVAVNDNIAEVLVNEDRNDEIIKTAFERLGDFQQDSRDEEESGFNTGLIGEDDTFLYLAADENNEDAFILGYKVLGDFCSNKECKLNFLCARNKRSRSRSRYFGVTGRESLCRTAQNKRRSYTQDHICYVHGSAVWGYHYELIDEDEIKDKDFTDEVINPEKCDNHCGSYRENDKCGATK